MLNDQTRNGTLDRATDSKYAPDRNGTLDGKTGEQFVRMTKNRSTLDNKNAQRKPTGSKPSKSSAGGNRLDSVFSNQAFDREHDPDAMSMATMNFNDPNDRHSKQQFNSQM